MNPPRSRRAAENAPVVNAIRAAAALALLTLAFAGCREATEPRTTNRDSIRAYYGAPPVIPHPVRELGRANCLACHADGLKPSDGPNAVPKPHATLGDCVQCHVEQQRDAKLLANNAFVGLAEPRRHRVVYAGAPPTIPHKLWLRENCLACHGPAATSH